MPKVINIDHLSETDVFDAPYYCISKEELDKSFFGIPDPSFWEKDENGYSCYNCDHAQSDISRYCPHCGAKMIRVMDKTIR